MANIASQVVLHPLVSQGLKFGSTTLGRDKTYRAVQYFSRFLAWYLISKGNKNDAVRWTALKAHLATARKLMRLGKPVEHLQAALRASFSPGPAAEQITTIGRQIGYFGYLALDALIWANTVKFINLNTETTKNIARKSSQFWFAGILFSIVNGVLKTVRLSSEAKKLQASKTWGEKDLGEETQREAKLSAVAAARAATRQQFTIDILDLWIPATGAEIVSINEGTLGILGLITSLMGMQAQWKAVGSKN